MATRKAPVQPRLKDDIGRVIEASAAKNNRTVTQEVDMILREYFFGERMILGRWHPGADYKPEDSRAPTPAEELGFTLKNGVLHGPDPRPLRIDYPKTTTVRKRAKK